MVFIRLLLVCFLMI